MTQDPEKQRRQSRDDCAGPIQWQSETERSETERSETTNERSNKNRDVETDQPARSDSAA